MAGADGRKRPIRPLHIEIIQKFLTIGQCGSFAPGSRYRNVSSQGEIRTAKTARGSCRSAERSRGRRGEPKTARRDTPAKGILIDLHPSAFAPGNTAITTVAYVGDHFSQIDAGPTYESAVFRSFAIAFAEWAIDAAAEFGVSVQ
jgi:hypothetical protein